MTERILIFILAIGVFYFGTRPTKVVKPTETIIDTLIVTDTLIQVIEGQASSSVEYDTLIHYVDRTDTLFKIDTVYTVSFDSITPRFGIKGKTFWRKGDRSTYKLELTMFPDSIETKLEYLLPDTLRAYMSVNSEVYLDSSIVFTPYVEPEWYETKTFWFGVGVTTTIGGLFLAKYIIK